MTTTMQQLIEQRARLVYALGHPDRVVQFEERRVERFSPEEILTAIAGLDTQIAAMSGVRESRMFTVASSSGLAGNQGCGGGDVRDDRYEGWR
jgi:hypothetical protein